MKRTIPHSWNSEPGREKSRRQDPVSCLFCRRKKLKCDRGSPCSNCRARKIVCESSVGESTPSHSATGQVEQSYIPSQNIDELNLRVKKLEELLSRQGNVDSNPAVAKQIHDQVPEIVHHKHETPEDVELSKTVSWLETDAFEHAPAVSEDQIRSDSRVAESFGSFIFSLTRPKLAAAFTQNIPTMLPPRHQGQLLLDYYVEHVNWIYQIIHVPTVRNIFDTVYTSVEQNKRPDYRQLALIATFFALSAYFSSPTAKLPFNTVDESTQAFRRFVALAQESLAAADCLSSPTVESLQSLILISQHLMPNIGAIATLRTLSATIMHTARTLGLHQIDSPWKKKQRENEKVDYVDLEVKRRIWWHITSTDWLLSFMSGAQCGTYMIHPKQMNVDYPTNVNDDAITPDGNYGQPWDQPTSMTYFIFRLKFSTVFREMVDAAWDSGSDMDNLPYEIVLQFDKKLQHLQADAENKSDMMVNNTLSQRATLGKEEKEGLEKKLQLLTRQKNMARFGLHTRLSRLHRPYLVRGAKDPQYAYSRMICLRSARTVIETGKTMISLSQDLSSIKIWSVNHHVFVSTVVLVMDYCFNKEEPRARERKEEILECFRVLESSKQDCTIATRGLRKLRGMLRERVTGGSGSEEEVEREKRPTVREVQSVLQYPGDGDRQERSQVQQHQHSRPQIQSPNQNQNQYQNQLPPIFSSTINTNANTNNASQPSSSPSQPPFSHPQPQQQIQPPLSLLYPPTQQQQPTPYYPDLDLTFLDDLSFNENLDTSQFEALFQGLDGGEEMI